MLRLRFKTREGRLDLGETRQVWRRFGAYARAHVGSLALAFLAAIGAVATQIAAPWPIKVIFDDVLIGGQRGSGLKALFDSLGATPTDIVGFVCGAILLIAIFDAVFCYFRDVLMATVGQQVVGKIRQDLFAHLQTLPPAVFERRKTGALLARLTGDIQMLRQMLVNALVTFGQGALTIVAMLSAMFWLNPPLALLALAATPISMWTSWRISRQIRVATSKQREKESEVAAIAHDVLGAMAVVQAFNRETIEQRRFSRQNRSTVRAGVKTTRLESRLDRTIALASAAALCLILYFGVRSVLTGVMTAGDLLVFLSYLRSVHKPMRNLAKLTSQLAKSTACGQRVGELFALQPAVCNAPDAVPLPPLAGEIAFDNVTFGYDPQQPVLHGVALHVAPGERVAIIGRTGAGKSTLIKLLLRFYDPLEGRVLVDGRDVRDVTTESLRRQIGWVHQDTVLFGMSILDNITLGRPDASLELVRAVAARVRADEFIERLPLGYDTVLGQGGVTLSGGQRQRLALARALLREPRILLLDEPATGLDALTRRVVEESWMSPANKATTLVICHRFDGMERFDRVVFLADGRIRALGTHAELLRTQPEYAALVAAGTDGAGLRIAESIAS